jgi:heterodisulfide reductase subunit A-like polyferredoxin
MTTTDAFPRSELPISQGWLAMTAERVLVIGGSISGLSAALAFAAQGFEVTIVEHDAAPSTNETTNFKTKDTNGGNVE